MRLFLALLSCCLVVAPARAAVWGDDPSGASPEDKASMAICQKAKAVHLPQADPGVAVAPDCDASALYYGIGRPADPAAARACALGRPAGAADDPLEGPAILATIYANGKGAPRDLDLATAYACRMDGAPAEMDARIAHLAKLKTDGPGKTPFDVCDDVTSGLMMGACAERDAEGRDAERAAALDATAKGLDPASQTAFARLRKLEAAYVEAVGANEVDMSGTARGALVVGAEQAHQDAFLGLLKAVLAGTVAGDAAGSLPDADRLLNATYGKVMGMKDVSGLGTVEKSGIKTTQRAWLIYRDAFVAFAKLAAPSVPPEAIKTELTIQRTKDLSGFLG